MPATYTPITLEQMQELLKADKGWKIVECPSEFVFEFAIPSFQGAVVKVYTSIPKGGVSRSVGKDSIKVCAAYVPANMGIVKTQYITRTNGWQDRLKARIIEVINTTKERRMWVLSKAADKRQQNPQDPSMRY